MTHIQTLRSVSFAVYVRINMVAILEHLCFLNSLLIYCDRVKDADELSKQLQYPQPGNQRIF